MTKNHLWLVLASTSIVAVVTACGTSTDGADGDAAGVDAGTSDSAAPDGSKVTTDAGTSDADAEPPPTPTYSVGATVAGLTGEGLVLQNDGGDDLAVSADGTFFFSKKLESGAAFAVTVKTQPTDPNQTCVVTGGAGTIAAGNVTSVVVNCTTTKYTVGGTVSGLVGSGLVLLNNAGDATPVNANGEFAFPAQDDGTAYAVTVQTNPSAPSQTCIVDSGTGTLAGANVTAVTVTCTTNMYSVGGTVSGLANGQAVVLQNNSGNDLSIDADGTFSFSAPVTSGATYAVTLLSNPSNRYCTVTNGAGTVTSGPVTDITVTCLKHPVAACSGWPGDDFEDGNADGWTMGNTGTSAVNAESAAEGTAFGLEVSGGAQTHYQGRRFSFASSQPSYLSIWLQPDASTQASNYVVLGDDNTSNNGILFLYGNDANWVFFNNDGGPHNVPLEVDQPVHFEMFFDWTAKTMWVKKNGVTVLTDLAFRTPSSAVTQLNLYNYSAGTRGRYDEIFLGGCP